MSPTSYRAAPPRGDRVTLPERCARVNPSRDEAPLARRGGGRRASAGPARQRQGFCCFSAGCGGVEGEPVAAGGGGVLLVVAPPGCVVVVEADGVVVVDGLAEAWPIRCVRVSESRRPVTLMFSAFW